jgi:uncharacterized protein YegP (UPF0339 family)
MGAFVISKRFNDEYKFVFSSKKGKIIFTSLSYALKFECEEAIVHFRNTIDSFDFIKNKNSKGNYFFKVMFDNTLFATSRKYSTELRLLKGINETKKDALKAEILDFSESTSIFLD